MGTFRPIQHSNQLHNNKAAMITVTSCCNIAPGVIIPLVAICLLPLTSSESIEDVEYVLPSRIHSNDPRDDGDKRTATDEGLASLLSKNLRFRDLSRRSYWKPDVNDAQDKSGLLKRGVSVSELAQMFNSLKARDTAGGMKLASLRFGK